MNFTIHVETTRSENDKTMEMKKMAKKDISYAESVRQSHEFMIAKGGEGQKMIGNLVIGKIERKPKK
jgi:hypothetical protein